MKFKDNVLFVRNKKPLYLHTLSLTEQKDILKEHPELEKFLVHENDNKAEKVSVDVKPKSKPRKRSGSKSKSGKSK